MTSSTFQKKNDDILNFILRRFIFSSSSSTIQKFKLFSSSSLLINVLKFFKKSNNSFFPPERVIFDKMIENNNNFNEFRIYNVGNKLKNLSLSSTLFVFEANSELISQPRFSNIISNNVSDYRICLIIKKNLKFRISIMTERL